MSVRLEEEDFEAHIAEQVVELRRARLGALPEEWLVWLALPPSWTMRLARACFPAEEGERLDDFLSAAESAGVCARTVPEDDEEVAWRRIEVRALLAAHLSESQLEVALDEVAALAHARSTVRALVALAPGLPAALRPRACKIAGCVTDQTLRTTALAALDGHVDVPRNAPEPMRADERRRRLQEARREVVASGGELNARRALEALAQAAAEAGDADAAIEAVSSIPKDTTRAQAFARLIEPLARGGAGDRTLAMAVRGVQAASHRLDPIRAVGQRAGIAHLLAAGERKRQAAAVARRAAVDYWGIDHYAAAATAMTPAEEVGVLIQLGEALTLDGESDPEAPRIFCRALELAHQIGDSPQRSASLVALAPHLAGEQRQRTIADAAAAARHIVDATARVRALASIVEHADEPLRQDLVREAVTAADSGGEQSFWVPEAERPDVLAHLKSRRGHTRLSADAARIATVMLDRSRDAVIPSGLYRWAKLAKKSGADVHGASRWLGKRVDRALRVGDVPEAASWLSTGSLVAEAVQSDLDTIVRFGSRRIELLYRRAQDERELKEFLLRTAQIEAFEDLLDDKEHWALHYLGVGGIGKTMLLRHLGRVAAEHALPISRVDFDHLNPGYPARRPGQLLYDLMGELQTYAQTTQHERLARTMQEQVLMLHRALGEESVAEDPLEGLRRREFKDALTAFCDYLELFESRVVLVLDTCEELERLQHPGGRLISVEATLTILEQVRERFDGLRVVFAGRRPLALSGHGWKLAEDAISGTREQLAQCQDYLRLHEIRGFRSTDALRFLRRAARRDVSQQMCTAILEASPDAGSGAPIVYDPPREKRPEKRYNPFELRLYASWVREDPSLTPQAISSINVYIERRILERIKADDVRQLVHAAVRLRRFDRTMIRPAFPMSSLRFDDAFRALSSEDWIVYQHDQALDVDFLEVDRHLRPRLEKYYRDEGIPLPYASEIADNLLRSVDTSAPERLAFEHLNAAIDLLSPDRAGAMWERLERKVAEAGAWSWAAQITDRLLGAEGVAADASHPLHAAIRATGTSAILHLQPTLDVEAAWMDVAASAPRDPRPPSRAWLESRARVGAAAAALRRGSSDGVQLVDLLRLREPVGAAGDDGWRARQLTISTCAAITALLDALDAGRAGGTPPAAEIAHWAAGLPARGEPGATCAIATCLAARAAALNRDWAAADALFARADDTACEHPAPAWLDWSGGILVRERVRLEALCTLAGREAPVLARADRWLEELLADDRTVERGLVDIDAERLASALLLRRLAAGVPERSLLERIEKLDIYRPKLRPSEAHRRTPTLVSTLARAYLPAGDAERAISVLGTRIDAALDSGGTASIKAAEHAMATVYRFMRGPGLPAMQRLAESLDVTDRTVAWPLFALTSPVRAADQRAPSPVGPFPADPQSAHIWWSCQPAIRAEDRQRLRDAVAAGALAHGSALPPFLAASLQLDCAEAARLEMRPTRTPSPAPPPGLAPEQEARLRLRAHALDHRGDGFAEELRAAGLVLGSRRTAELALEEGELLAMRLPREAAPLLRYAGLEFSMGRDAVGAFVALVREALAWQHVGDYVSANAALLDRALPAYGALVAGDAGARLPPLDQIVGVAGRGKPMEALATLKFPRPWIGWLRRLVVCLAWHGGKPISEAATQGLLELEPGAATVSAPSLSAPARRRARRAGSLLAGALTGLLPIVVGFGVVRAFAEIRPDAVTIGIFAAVAALVAVAPLTSVARAAALALRSRSASRAEASLLISREAGIDRDALVWPPPGTITAVLLYRRIAPGIRIERFWFGPPLPIPRLSRRTVAVEHAQSPRLGPYFGPGGGLPSGVAEGLREIARLTRGRPASVAIRLEPTIAGLPWEALVAAAAMPDGGPGATAWRMRRTALAPLQLPSTPAGNSPPRGAGVCVLAASGWYATALQSWARSEVRYTLAADMVDLGRWRVVHIIAPTVSSSAGPVLEVAIGRRGSTRIRPERLPVRGAIVVLQGEPLDGTRRSDTERMQAAELRVVAAALMDESVGAAAVIVLPSLSPELSEVVLKSIVRPFADEATPSHAELLSALVDVRGAIAHWRPAATPPAARDAGVPADRRELAMDVCLYTR